MHTSNPLCASRENLANKPKFFVADAIFRIIYFYRWNVSIGNWCFHSIWKCFEFNWCIILMRLLLLLVLASVPVMICYVHLLFACQFETDANILTIYLRMAKKYTLHCETLRTHSSYYDEPKWILLFRHGIVIGEMQCVFNDTLASVRASNLIVSAKHRPIHNSRITCLHIRNQVNKVFVDYVR